MTNINKEYKRVLIVGVSSIVGKNLIKIYSQNGYKIYGTYNNYFDKDLQIKCESTISANLDNSNGINKLLKFSEEIKANNIIYLPGFIDNFDLYNTSLDSLKKSFYVNFFSYLLLISKTSNYMKSMNYGRYLSISSIGSKYGGSKNSINYTLSKHLLEFFPREYKNLAEFNVFFNNIICGVINSEIIKNKKDFNIEKRIEKIPIKRSIDPYEIARNCYRLCSDENTCQTLSNITISGGE